MIDDKFRNVFILQQTKICCKNVLLFFSLYLCDIFVLFILCDIFANILCDVHVQLQIRESMMVSSIEPATGSFVPFATSKDKGTTSDGGRRVEPVNMKTMENGLLIVKKIGFTRITNKKGNYVQIICLNIDYF